MKKNNIDTNGNVNKIRKVSFRTYKFRQEEEIVDDDAIFVEEEPVPTAQNMVAFGELITHSCLFIFAFCELIIHSCLFVFALGQKKKS